MFECNNTWDPSSIVAVMCVAANRKAGSDSGAVEACYPTPDVCSHVSNSQNRTFLLQTKACPHMSPSYRAALLFRFLSPVAAKSGGSWGRARALAPGRSALGACCTAPRRAFLRSLDRSITCNTSSHSYSSRSLSLSLHIYICVCIYTHIHTYTHIYTYILACVFTF